MQSGVNMFVFIASFIALLAMALLWFALRGRRIDIHHLCRKCDYDLTGRAVENSVCSECGSDLGGRNAIRIGHRVRRRRLSAVALFGLAISAGTIGTIEYQRRRNGNWMEYAPVWVLRHELNSRDPRQLAAIAELTRRLQDKKLTSGQIAAVADKCLAVQADLSTPWLPVWGDFVEMARNAQELDDARWATYAEQGPLCSVAVRPAAVVGDEIPLEPALSASRVSKQCFLVYLSIQYAELDGHPIPQSDFDSVHMEVDGKVISNDSSLLRLDAVFPMPGNYPNQHRFMNGMRIPRELSAKLATGEHRFTAKYLLYLVESDAKCD